MVATLVKWQNHSRIKIAGKFDWNKKVSDFLEKLSSYNLFNYLFPGVVFCLFVDEYFSYSLIQEDIVVGVFLYYFVGLVISRIGSLFIEPMLKKIHFITFADYRDFVSASKTDSKLEILSEVNNMYRTIISLFFLLAIISGYESLICNWPDVIPYSKYVVILLLFFMFLFSYKKQTEYIYKRILSTKNRPSSE